MRCTRRREARRIIPGARWRDRQWRCSAGGVLLRSSLLNYMDGRQSRKPPRVENPNPNSTTRGRWEIERGYSWAFGPSVDLFGFLGIASAAKADPCLIGVSRRDPHALASTSVAANLESRATNRGGHLSLAATVSGRSRVIEAGHWPLRMIHSTADLRAKERRWGTGCCKAVRRRGDHHPVRFDYLQQRRVVGNGVLRRSGSSGCSGCRFRHWGMRSCGEVTSTQTTAARFPTRRPRSRVGSSCGGARVLFVIVCASASRGSFRAWLPEVSEGVPDHTAR